MTNQDQVFNDDVVSILLFSAAFTRCPPFRCPDVQQLWTDHSAGHRGTSGVVQDLVRELERHYLTAKEDVLLGARSTPLHGGPTQNHSTQRSLWWGSPKVLGSTLSAVYLYASWSNRPKHCLNLRGRGLKKIQSSSKAQYADFN